MGVTFLIKRSENSELTARTVRSIRGLSSYDQESFRILIEESSGVARDTITQRELVAPGAIGYQNTGWLDEDDYLVCVESGTTYSRGAFDRVVTDLRQKSAYRVYVHAEGSYNYLLNRSLDDGSTLRIQDEDRLWVGSTPPVVKVQLLKELPSNLIYEQELLFAQLMESEGEIGNAQGSVSTINFHEEKMVRSPEVFHLEWYLNFAESWHNLFREQASGNNIVPRYIQRIFVYLLQFRFKYNTNTANKQVVRGDDLEQFLDVVSSALAFLDDDVIMHFKQGLSKVNRSTRIYFLKLKHGEEFELEYSYAGADIEATFKGNRIARASTAQLVVDSMDVFEEHLEITGYIPALVDFSRVQIVLENNQSRRILLDDKRYCDYNLFGKQIHRHPTFHVRIPMTEIIAGTEFEFFLESPGNGVRIQLPLYFRKPMSKLTNRNRSYWATDGILVSEVDRTIRVKTVSAGRLFRAEVMFCLSLLRNREKHALRAVLIRIAYWASKKRLGQKPIWIYYDKLYKGGDNGEYAYEYARKQTDNIDKLYVINRDAPDAARMRRRRVPYQKFGTLKHKLKFLNASIVFATHTPQYNMNGFKFMEKHFRGLFKYRTVFIQHGLTVQRIPWYQQKFIDNTRLYCIASTFERQNLLHAEYGYEERDLACTGLARYDGLVRASKKQILITPTWRNYLAPPASLGRARERQDQFGDTDYFKIYDRLLRNPKLNNAAALAGYSIVYLLHPVTSSQLEDYTGYGKQVRVIAATSDVSYEKLLSESDLMVTDYSGVQFDFAYMNKPVVYYHPKDLPASYDEGAYKYDKDALGEICHDEEELVDLLCEYIESGCQIKDEYRSRVASFFYHPDKNNSQRIYEAALKLQEK